MKKLISFVTIIFLTGTILSGCNTSDKPISHPKQVNNQTNIINNSNESNVNNNNKNNNNTDTSNAVSKEVVVENINTKENIQNNNIIFNNNYNKNIQNDNIILNNNYNSIKEDIQNSNIGLNNNNIILNNNYNKDVQNNNIILDNNYINADSEEVDSTETTTVINKENQEKKEIIDSLVFAKYGVPESDIQKHKEVMYKLNLKLLHSLKEYNIIIILIPPEEDLSSYLNNHYNTEYEIDKYSGMIYYNERIIFVQSRYSGKTTLHEIGHFFDYVNCYQENQTHEEIQRKSDSDAFRNLVVSEKYSYGRLEDYCKEDVLNYYKKGAYALSNLHEFYAESFAKYFYCDAWYNSYEYDMPDIYNYYNNYHIQGII